MSKLLFDIEEDAEEEIKDYFCSNCEKKFPKDDLTQYRKKFYCVDCIEEVKEKSKKKKAKPVVQDFSEIEKLRKDQKDFQEQQLAILRNMQEIISKMDSLPTAKDINLLQREFDILKSGEYASKGTQIQKEYKFEPEEINDLEIVEIQKRLFEANISDSKKLKEAYKDTKIYEFLQNKFRTMKFKTDMLKLVIKEAIKDISKIKNYFSIEIFRSWLIEYGLEKEFWNIFTKHLRGNKNEKLQLLQAIINDLNLEDKIQLISGDNVLRSISSFNSMLVIRILFHIKKGNRRQLANFASENKELLDIIDLTKPQILMKISHGLDQLKKGEIIHKGIYGYELGRE